MNHLEEALIAFLSAKEGITIGYDDITVNGNRMEYGFKEYEVHYKQPYTIFASGLLVFEAGDYSIYDMGYSIDKLSCYL